jgi:hypothetical protein
VDRLNGERQAGSRLPSARRNAAAPPRVEVLEDRCTPAVFSFFFGSTLNIIGDDAANLVQIVDDGTANNSHITVRGPDIIGTRTSTGARHAYRRR